MQPCRQQYNQERLYIGEVTGEATSSSELPDHTTSEYNLSEDIFSEIESEISIK
jgi:hypothetical protein